MDNRQDQDETVMTFYRNTIGYNEGANRVFVYTKSMEDWKTFSKELSNLVLYKAIKAFMIGILIGLFTGFFTARADEATVRRVVMQEAKDMDQAASLMAIAFIESSFRPNAVGGAREQGLYQLHPKYFKLKDMSIRTQVKTAIKHMNFLTEYCPDVSIALAWNLGCSGARKIKKPKKFAYNIKFSKLKVKYEKEITQNKRSNTPNFCEVANIKNSYQALRKGQVKSVAWSLVRRREHNIPSI